MRGRKSIVKSVTTGLKFFFLDCGLPDPINQYEGKWLLEPFVFGLYGGRFAADSVRRVLSWT